MGSCLYTPSIVAPPTTDSTPTQPQQPSQQHGSIVGDITVTIILCTIVAPVDGGRLAQTLVQVLVNYTTTLSEYFQSDPHAFSYICW